MPVKDVVVPTKSAADTREYRVVTLSNNMQAILVSDPETDKSGAAVAVQVGSFSDPKECLGLAHYEEHMLFMASERYDREGDYGTALNKYGGSMNAWTDKEVTNYFFDVSPDHLEEILDRFSAFFVCPLFTPSASDRELNAVHSEHQKNLQVDFWREFQMLKQAMNPDHPYGRFATGDLTTLRDAPLAANVDVRKELLAFHEKYYSANLMRLCIYGREDLDTLEKYADKYFSTVKDTQAEVPSYPGDSDYIVAEPRTVFEFEPVTDRRRLNLAWILPEDTAIWEENPLGYLSSLVGDEGPGSVLALLKTKGWAEGLTTNRTRERSFAEFEVSVSLTESGLEHVAEITHIILSYLDMIKNSKDDDLKRVYEEMSQIDQNQFRFKSKEKAFNYVSNLTTSLIEFPAKDVLRAPYYQLKFEPSLWKKYAGLMTLDNCVIQVVAKAVKSDRRLFSLNSNVSSTDKDWEIEPYYKIPYHKYPVTITEASRLSKPIADAKSLALPPPNRFIATDFSIRASDDEERSLITFEGVPADFPSTVVDGLYDATLAWQSVSPVFGIDIASLTTVQTPAQLTSTASDQVRPIIGDKADIVPAAADDDKYKALLVPPVVVSVPLPQGPWLPTTPVFDTVSMVDRLQPVELWYKRDTVFQQPKVNINILIQSPLAYATPRVHVLTMLMVRVAMESLAEELYPSTIAGLHYSVDAMMNGVGVSVTGFNHKAASLTHAVMTRLRALPTVLTPALFEMEKDKLMRSYSNSLKNSAYSQALYTEAFALSAPIFHTHEKIAVLAGLTGQDLLTFIAPFFSSGRLLMYVHGNQTKAEAVRLAQALVALCMMKPPMASELVLQRRVLLPAGDVVLQAPNGNPNDTQCSVKNLYQLSGPLNSAQADYRTLAYGEMLNALFNDITFDMLRTKEQLGYIVACIGRLQPEGYTLSFLVQSDRPGLYLDSRIEALLEHHIPSFFAELSDEVFDTTRASKIADLLEKDNSAGAEAGRHWGKIIQRSLDFTRGLKTAMVMATLTKEDVLKFFMAHLHPEGAYRRKLSTQVLAMKSSVITSKAEYIFPIPTALPSTSSAVEDGDAKADGDTDTDTNADKADIGQDTLKLIPTQRTPALLLEPRQLGQFKRTLAMSPALM